MIILREHILHLGQIIIHLGVIILREIVIRREPTHLQEVRVEIMEEEGDN